MITPDELLNEYYLWKRHKSKNRLFHWWKPYTACQAQANQYDRVARLMLYNQDALYDLIFSGKVSDENELSEIIFMAPNTGSVSKKDNLYWIPFLKRVRERIEELPISIQMDFEWRGRVHHYWD